MVIKQRDKRGRLYRCYCGKVFPKYQALGGHMSSHTKPRKPKAEKGKAQKHQCQLCEALFDMGQALGGHMRRHRELLMRIKDQTQQHGVGEAEPLTDSTTNHREELKLMTQAQAKEEDRENKGDEEEEVMESGTGSRFVHAFNLNEPPEASEIIGDSPMV
ncbi:zinc finger protein ZAT9 [Amborella trichopoda]|nr:zinc finger protein ZAT9 [Amborella trichopoda]|eukprot:XP_006844293.2 zinc finger protein ZAT9 [Amborella trichopoda]